MVTDKITLVNIIEERPIYQLLQESKQTIDELLETKDIEFINDKTQMIYIILQKYKYYFQFIDNDLHINIKKIIFFKHLIKSIYKIINIDYDSIECYLSKTNDEFILYIVNDILNSIDMESRFNLLINDIDNLKKLVAKNDIYANIKYITDSSYYNDSKDIKDILDKIPTYKTYINICNHTENKEKYEEYKNIKAFELINKKEGNNYAGCSGIYIYNNEKVINNKFVYINKNKTRFIAYSNNSWILTSTEWMESIINESKGKDNYEFGGFHSTISTGSNIPVVLSKWKEYDIKIIINN